MDIEVVLTENDPKLGKRGQVVKVSSGFAQNYLFPNHKAQPATASNVKIFNEEKKRQDKHDAEVLSLAKDAAAKITALTLKMEVSAGEGEKLYGAVTNQDIAAALAAQHISVDRKKIHLEEPIKKTGSYQVSLKLHAEVSAVLKLEVVKKI